MCSSKSVRKYQRRIERNVENPQKLARSLKKLAKLTPSLNEEVLKETCVEASVLRLVQHQDPAVAEKARQLIIRYVGYEYFYLVISKYILRSRYIVCVCLLCTIKYCYCFAAGKRLSPPNPKQTRNPSR